MSRLFLLIRLTQQSKQLSLRLSQLPLRSKGDERRMTRLFIVSLVNSQKHVVSLSSFPFGPSLRKGFEGLWPVVL